MSLLTELKLFAGIFYKYAAPTVLAMKPTQPKLTGSMSTVSITSSGNASVPMIFARDWLNLLIARVRNMIW
jgi:hypothetical protein